MVAGTDPMAERKAEGEAKQKEIEARQREAENSFENVAREWWKWWLIGKSPRHADTTMRRMEADVFPAYGHKPINAVTAADVRQLMIAVEKRDARDVAKRIHETTSQIFRFAIARDIASRSPAADFKPRDILAEAQTENRARVDARDLPELLVKIDEYNGDAITRLAIKLMAYSPICYGKVPHRISSRNGWPTATLWRRKSLALRCLSTSTARPAHSGRVLVGLFATDFLDERIGLISLVEIP
jgi:hypothetical protein